MTLTEYRIALKAQGRVWCRSVWFDNRYVARLQYMAIAALYKACQWNEWNEWHEEDAP